MSFPGKWTLESILTLSRIKGINSAIQRRIVEETPELTLSKNGYSEYLSKALSETQLFNDSLLSNIRRDVNEQMNVCQAKNFRIITLWDEEYPSLLKEITHPPMILYISGSLNFAEKLIVSVVGTRRCTHYGRLITEKFVESFVNNGIIVCSGLAYGIDTIAHLQTVKSGGTTIAVIASGLDKILPSYTQKNADKIIETGGCIISEYPCGTLALPGYFPQRNRIISGISKATLVIESALKGGALITAKFAFDQGREVFAVPGRINDEKSKGTNELIRKNIASPAVSPESILEGIGITQFNFIINNNNKEKISFSSESEKSIFESLSNDPLHVDSIAESTKLEISEILVALLNLEFRGLIRQLPGKYYIRDN